MLVCHQNYVCSNYVGSVYVGGYGGLNELCQVRFLVVGDSPSVLLLPVVMSYVMRGGNG